MHRAAALRSLAPVALFVAVPLALGGCGPRPGSSAAHPRSPTAAPLARVQSEDEYNAERAELEALPVDAADRPARRTALMGYVLGRLETALQRGHLEEAYEQLGAALGLYEPTELRGHPEDPALLKAAQGIERAFRRRGAHEQVLVALSVQMTLAPGDAEARGRYEQVLGWLRSSGAGEETDPSASADGQRRVIEDLEAVEQLWPAPVVVDQLSALYLEADAQGGAPPPRHPRKLSDLRDLLRSRGAPSTAYHLARLYLRVSLPEAAQAQLKRLIGRPGDDPRLRALVERYVGPSAKPTDAVALAMVFTQQGRDDRDVSARVCRDAARRFPSAPEPRMCAGQLALSLDQLVVALKQFEEAVRLEPTRREAWEALAQIYHQRLFQLVSDENLDVRMLDPQLKKVEAFHLEAERRFPGQPLKPSTAGAVFEIGRGYYNAGRAQEATRYLERSLSIDPSPSALELLGQIHLKKGAPDKGAAMFDRAIQLPKKEPEALYWRAKLRRQLGDAFQVAGDASGAEVARRAGVADWDVLLGLGLTPEASVEAAIERAKLLYDLGDRDQALQSFQKAIDAVPSRGSTYADVIAFLVPRGELADALDAYHRALGRSEVTDYLKVYCSLWVIDLARRAGEPEDPLATAYLKSTDGGKWYDDLARWATGRESDQSLLKRADTPARRAEAYFYQAMRAESQGRKAEARHLWKKVLDTDMMAFFEYDMAALYLRLGAAPTRPLVPPSPEPPASPPRPKVPEGSI